MKISRYTSFLNYETLCNVEKNRCHVPYGINRAQQAAAYRYLDYWVIENLVWQRSPVAAYIFIQLLTACSVGDISRVKLKLLDDISFIIRPASADYEEHFIPVSENYAHVVRYCLDVVKDNPTIVKENLTQVLSRLILPPNIATTATGITGANFWQIISVARCLIDNNSDEDKTFDLLKLSNWELIASAAFILQNLPAKLELVNPLVYHETKNFYSEITEVRQCTPW